MKGSPFKYSELGKTHPNLVDVQTLAHDILKRSLDNHANWISYHAKGVELCNLIEKVKGKTLKNATDSSRLYPKELIVPCDRLLLATNELEKVTQISDEIHNKLIAIRKLCGNGDVVLFRTWPIDKYVQFAADVSARYRDEMKMKRNVAENIAHSSTQTELCWHAAIWEYPSFVNRKVDLIYLGLSKDCV